MLVEYTACIEDTIVIDPEEIKGMTEAEIKEYINEIVLDSACDELENDLTWEIIEEDK